MATTTKVRPKKRTPARVQWVVQHLQLIAAGLAESEAKRIAEIQRQRATAESELDEFAKAVAGKSDWRSVRRVKLVQGQIYCLWEVETIWPNGYCSDVTKKQRVASGPIAGRWTKHGWQLVSTFHFGRHSDLLVLV